MKKFLKKIKNEDGSVLVIVAICMVVLLAFAAFVIDMGLAYVTRENLQNAADAAALAGAKDLPDAGAAYSTAKEYAALNGVQSSETTVTTPFNGDSKQIEVVCSKTIQYSFARVLGLTQTTVTARAVAKKSEWDGDALPFINLDDDYTADTQIEAWEKTSPGDFESISNYEIVNQNDPETLYFKVDYQNGIELKKGTVANKKQEIGEVYDSHYPDKPVYIISLSSDVMNSGCVLLTDGTTRSLSKLKNKDTIDPSQLVLLKCTFDEYDENAKHLFLTVLDVYDIANNEFPSDTPNGGSSMLVK